MCQYGTVFVRTIDVTGAKHHLPAGSHAAGREENVVITVALVQFRPFARAVMFVSVEDDAGRTDDLGSVSAQLADGDDAFQPGAAAGVCVCQVDFAVLIPNGAGISFTSTGLLHGPSARDDFTMNMPWSGSPQKI